MKTKMVVCPTYQRAVDEWKRLQRIYPDIWTHSSKNGLLLTLTHINGTKYIFNVDTPRALLGFHGDVVYMDEFAGEDFITSKQ